MNVIKETIGLLFETVVSMLSKMGNEISHLFDARDTAFNTILAGILGISVGAASLIVIVWGIIKLVFKETKH